MTDSAAIAFALNRSANTPVFVQICEALRRVIISGQIGCESRLPPSRSFAVELGVSRSTVVAAYEQLAAEGYVEGRRGSGFYVCAVGELELGAHAKAGFNVESPSSEWPAAPRRQQPSSPDMRLFPFRQWARCVARVARLSPEALVTNSDPFGDRVLREAIARYLAEWRGLNVSPRQILITAGSVDALETCVRTLATPQASIGLEDPGYSPLRNFATGHGIRPLWLPVGPDGVEVPQQRRRTIPPKLVVLTPSHQYPLGGAMTPGRRMEFLNWAEENGSWIVEDDYDSEFRYAGRPIPALAGFDRAGRTIYVGSFSKIFSDGLRLGFLVTPNDLIDEFAATLSRFGTKASVASQRALAAFMDSGEFYRHIRRVRRIYGERRRVLIELLQSELGYLVSFEDHQAGMQIVGKLPSGYDDRTIANAATQEGAVTTALSTYYGGTKPESGLMFGFCAYTEDEIRFNVDKIRSAIERMAAGQ